MKYTFSITDIARGAFYLTFNNARVTLVSAVCFIVFRFFLQVILMVPVFKHCGVQGTQDYQELANACLNFLEQNMWLLFIAVALYGVMMAWIGAGLNRVMLDLAQFGYSAVSRLFSISGWTLAKLIGGGILFALLLLPAYILIIPGIYLTIRLLFWSFFMIDHDDIDIIESFRLSWYITQGQVWQLLGLNIIILAIAFIGYIIPFASIITLPIIIAHYAIAYEQLNAIRSAEVVNES